jgi:signal transduction histidine kinase
LRISVRTKQIAGVTGIVFAVVALLGGYYVRSIADVLITDTRTRSDFIANSVFHMITRLAQEGGDLTEAIRKDGGLQSTLEASAFSRHAQYAAVVGRDGVAIAHSDPTQQALPMPQVEDFRSLADAGTWEQARVIYTQGGRTYEVRVPLMLDSGTGVQAFGEIRVGVSTLLLRDDIEQALRPALITAIALLVGAVLVATLLAQWALRPILMLRSGLARLGQGETGVTLAFPQHDEFADLSESFNVVSARLEREHADGQVSRAALSRRMAALGRVSSGIAHEVRNPLNAMRIHLELLRQRMSDTPGTEDHVRVLSDQMRRLDEVVQGFLTFTRPEDLKVTAIQTRDVFEALLPVVEAEAGKTGVRVEIDAPADVPPIAGDPSLLHQALLNLALNACQAMPNGGRLRLASRRSGHAHVQLLIEDTGTGITPENLEKIFNLYFTTKPEGSGIGLALVYRTISLHDGDIDVQSVPGQGTTFTVTLPTAGYPDGPLGLRATA